jgi:glyoxylase-like metal-dependent hydrolase (beta-lactamase superfamily II)
MNVSQIEFNSYCVNTYLLAADRDNTAVVIDPACSNEAEFSHLKRVIEEKKLDVVCILLTHTHADHILGVNYVKDLFPDAQFLMHEEGLPLYENANDYSMVMGFKKREFPAPSGFLSDGQVLKFSDIKLKVLYTPGHAPGSVCYYAMNDDFVFTGDVLFRNSIGRTDLPGGSLDTLLYSIKEKLFTLPDNTTVLAGHEGDTGIGLEKQNNPFLQ